MSRRSKTKLQVVRGKTPLGPMPPIDLQHAWFELVRDEGWISVGLVPVEFEMDTFVLATGMARMAAHEPDAKVLLVNAGIKNAQELSPKGRQGPEAMDDVWATVAGASPTETNQPDLPYDLVDFSKLPRDQAERALDYGGKMLGYLDSEGRNYTRAVFSVDSPLEQTRCIPLLRCLDRVVLCLKPGESKLQTAERIIEIVGRERMGGAILLSGDGLDPETPLAF